LTKEEGIKKISKMFDEASLLEKEEKYEECILLNPNSVCWNGVQ